MTVGWTVFILSVVHTLDIWEISSKLGPNFRPAMEWVRSVNNHVGVLYFNVGVIVRYRSCNQ